MPLTPDMAPDLATGGDASCQAAGNGILCRAFYRRPTRERLVFAIGSALIAHIALALVLLAGALPAPKEADGLHPADPLSASGIVLRPPSTPLPPLTVTPVEEPVSTASTNEADRAVRDLAEASPPPITYAGKPAGGAETDGPAAPETNENSDKKWPARASDEARRPDARREDSPEGLVPIQNDDAVNAPSFVIENLGPELLQALNREGLARLLIVPGFSAGVLDLTREDLREIVFDSDGKPRSNDAPIIRGLFSNRVIALSNRMAGELTHSNIEIPLGAKVVLIAGRRLDESIFEQQKAACLEAGIPLSAVRSTAVRIRVLGASPVIEVIGIEKFNSRMPNLESKDHNPVAK